MAAKGIFSLELRFTFLLAFILNPSIGSKLNVPKLLLPYYSQTAANFTLEVSDGCFTWHSSRPEVASVYPLGASGLSACSRTAVVTAVSSVQTRKTTIITAEDSVTSQQLRCDVIIDEIKQIHIETTTKELFLDDSPEEYVIRASNDKNDMFSSIDGMIFDWSLISDKDSGEQASNVLRLLKYSESSYTALPHIKLLEDHGKRGDRILMKGLQTGAAIISVKAADPAYKHLPEHQVRVLVVANLQLTPSVVYLLPHARVTYRVDLLKQGKSHEVKMPSKQYYLELEDASVASLNSKTSTVTAVEFGFTELKLKDQTLQPTDTFREPSAGVHVVSPAYLEFTVSPDPNWLLETQRTYTVCVNAFDGESRKIFASENLRIVANFPDRHFRVAFASTNGTFYVVETLQKGFTTLTAQLKSVLKSDGRDYTFDKPVEGTQAVEIFDPVKLLPKSVVLPWQSSGRTVHFNFMASGGSGNYSWHSSNPGAGVVTASGVLLVGSANGSTNVTASDIRNLAHFDTSQVSVVPPTELIFLPSQVEAVIGSQLRLPIALFGTLDGVKSSFDECHTLALDVQLSDVNTFQKISVQESSTKGACADLVLEATAVGYIKATVGYKVERLDLQAVQVIAAYPPLRPFWPKEAVLTLGSSLEIVFEGGPHPWVLDASGFFQTAVLEKKTLVSSGEPYISDASKHHHSVGVRCLGFGEQTLTLKVGNKPTAKNLFPTSSTAELIVACEAPKGLQLFPEVERPSDLPPCPVSSEFDDPVPVPLLADVKVVAVLTDRLGRKFKNFSSLVIDWQLSNPSLGTFLDQSQNSIDRRKHKCHADHRWISTNSKTGVLTVTVQIDRYSSQVKESWFTEKSVNPPIVKSRSLHLVGYPRFSRDQVNMFNHQDVKTSVDIQQGSGHFLISQNEEVSKIANIIYHKDANDRTDNITVVPLSEGSIELSVTDLCLSPVKTAVASISISDIVTVELLVVDKVELNREVEASLRILDGNFRPIESSFFSLMDIQLISRSEFISVSPSAEKGATDQFSASYSVRGKALGRAYLQVSAVAKTGRKITSSAKEIQVFPPLRLKPKNITIIPGTYFQVTAFGGPQPESTIEFRVKNSAVATVTNDGLVRALELGTTEIIAMATGLDASNSSRIIFSQDSSIVVVVELAAVRVVAPLKRIQAGNRMPVYVVGHTENVTPFSFADVAPPLEFRWHVSNDQVALLRPVFYENGIELSDEGNFAVRFHALSSGQVTLKLTVKGHHSRTAPMTDSITIQVFDRLGFLTPPIHDGSILMMPNTELYVKTNRHGSTAQLSYAVVEPMPSSSDQPAVVSVSQSGLVMAGGYPGHAYLQVTAHEEFGVNHSMVILVKVKPLSYIMINAETVVRTRFPGVTSFPVGTTINFVVSLHDDVGEKFYAIQSNVHFRLNKYDRIQVLYGKTNSSLSARANSPGLTVLKVYEKLHPSVIDYIGIPVDSAIHPSQVKTMLGGIVCFSSHLLTREGHDGNWLSSGDKVTIDSVSGISVADRVGSSQIIYNVSYAVTQTTIKVVPVANIILRETASVPFLTNVKDQSHSGSSFPVVLENFDHGCKAGIQGANCSEKIRLGGIGAVQFLPFTCSMQFTESHPDVRISNFLDIRPSFDAITGKHSCHVDVLSNPDLLPLAASYETSVEVHATVLAQEGQTEITSNELVIPFHPAFYVQNREIVLSVVQPLVNLAIVATEAVLSEIQIISSDESIVRVRLHHRSSTANQKVMKFPLELQLSSRIWALAPTAINLTVTCILTGQSQVVAVNVLKGDQAEMGWSHLVLGALHRHFYTIIIFVVVIICLFLTYNLMRGQSHYYSSAHASSSPAASVAFLHSNKTPFAPAHSPRSSPTTNLWSVDHSPYGSNGFRYRSSRGSPPSL